MKTIKARCQVAFRTPDKKVEVFVGEECEFNVMHDRRTGALDYFLANGGTKHTRPILIPAQMFRQHFQEI